MERFGQMSVFVAVAECGGFSAAARQLNISPPVITRAIASLESSLGVKLFNRTTRYVRLTEAGRRFLEDSKRILDDVRSAEEAAIGVNAEPQGHISVTAPSMFGQKFVIPCVVDYLNRYPKTRVDAIFLDRVVNLLEEGIDVGIRIGQLADSSMRALKVGSVRLILCAAPEYLEKHGAPKLPADLKQHAFISASAGSMGQDVKFHTDKGPVIVKQQPRLNVNSNPSAIEAALFGMGLTRVISYQVEDHLAAGSLVAVLENFELPPLPVHILHREGRLDSAKVRAFIDLMAEHLKNELQPHDRPVS